MWLLVCRLKWWIWLGEMQVLFGLVRQLVLVVCRKLKLFGRIFSILLVVMLLLWWVSIFSRVKIMFCLWVWVMFLEICSCLVIFSSFCVGMCLRLFSEQIGKFLGMLVCGCGMNGCCLLLLLDMLLLWKWLLWLWLWWLWKWLCWLF